jgi:DNA-binding response OmpR family regulator
MLSVLGKEVGASRAEQAGADEYVAKPFSPKALVATVEALLAS